MRPHNKAASCRGVLSNSGSSRRFVYRTADAARSEVGCTPGGQPRELVQSSSENDSHAATLDFLAGVRDYIASWPAHPMNRDMIQRIEAHLAEPAHHLARHAVQTRSGGAYTPAGLPVLTVTAEGDTVTITAPPEGKGVPDELLLRRLRRGECITLRPKVTA